MFSTFQEAFLGINEVIISHPDYTFNSRIGKTREITSINYLVEDMSSFEFENPEIGRIDYKYANTFYEWMISGSTDVKELADQYPNAARFLEKPKSKELPENFNTFYGPRIAEQLDKVVKELTNNPNSRRAVISILEKGDLDLLDKDETLEFPCADSCTFFIRDNKFHCHLHMRSQNMGQVLKLDMYLWGRFACELAKKLGYETGKFRSSVVSAHVFERDIKYLSELIKNNK